MLVASRGAWQSRACQRTGRSLSLTQNTSSSHFTVQSSKCWRPNRSQLRDDEVFNAKLLAQQSLLLMLPPRFLLPPRREQVTSSSSLSRKPTLPAKPNRFWMNTLNTSQKMPSIKGCFFFFQVFARVSEKPTFCDSCAKDSKDDEDRTGNLPRRAEILE